MTANAQFWDDLAEEYSLKPVPNPESYAQKLVLAKSRLAARDTVLDVGCGTGSLALELAPHAGHVHAVDISREMLKIANRKASDLGIDNVSFHQATLEEPPSFEPKSFDVVCAFNILHLVADREQTLRWLFRMLRPGGTFISSTLCLKESLMPYGALLAMMRWFGKAPPVQLFSKRQLDRELQHAGFRELSHPDVGAKPTVAFIIGKKPS